MYSEKKNTNVIGLMSGTSLDGLDLAACTFHVDDNRIDFHIESAITIPYDAEMKRQLEGLYNADARAFAQFHATFGHYLGVQVARFVKSTGFHPDFVASHGHTVFHDPGAGFTSQIGDGAAIAIECGFQVVCDFRTTDVAAGGQGAPLVPIGDKLLFSSWDACLNIGGIANISFDVSGNRIAYDICPANMVLNYLAAKLGHSFDDNGLLASSGKVLYGLLEELLTLDYFHQSYPKSLGREWFEEKIMGHICEYSESSVPDLLCTFTEMIAVLVSKEVHAGQIHKMLVTGGGAHNGYLLQRLRYHCACELEVPDALIVNYKEALVFAFLGLLRMNNQHNCLSSVTGACRNVTGGAVYLP